MQYKKQFMGKYKQEEENNNLSTLINEIFNSMESVHDTVFDYQNDKQYSFVFLLIHFHYKIPFHTYAVILSFSKLKSNKI